MSEERKDVRVKVDYVVHADLTLLCRQSGLDIGEWVERLIVEKLEQLCHNYIVEAPVFERMGTTRKLRDRARKPE